jgi:hypothetical protein
MNNWKKYSLVLVTAVFLVIISGSSVFAQGNTTARSIRGAVYLDVNRDGRCVNTGVAGEVPVVGVNVEFVSSDRQHVITLYTGDDGTYGLVAVGHDNWTVTAKPDASKYVVTSTNPLRVPVFDETPVQTGVNFCVTSGTSGSGASGVIGAPGIIVLPVVLPESGAPAATVNSTGLFVLLTAVFGLLLIAIGAALEWRRRTNS